MVFVYNSLNFQLFEIKVLILRKSLHLAVFNIVGLRGGKINLFFWIEFLINITIEFIINPHIIPFKVSSITNYTTPIIKDIHIRNILIFLVKPILHRI